ncbi:MAG TPA: hypothetical protein VGQ00_04205 [Candidatus Norongarragalinales archaeon]|jgi:hypothetical protein|nr:hypothetical protein [Candidatus Norongarragalinales archaeon]
MALRDSLDPRTVWGAVLFLGFAINQFLATNNYAFHYVAIVWVLLLAAGFWLTLSRKATPSVEPGAAKWWIAFVALAAILQVSIQTRFLPLSDEFVGVGWLASIGLAKLFTAKGKLSSGRYWMGVFWVVAAILLAVVPLFQEFVYLYFAVVVGIPLVLSGTGKGAHWKNLRAAERGKRRARR